MKKSSFILTLASALLIAGTAFAFSGTGKALADPADGDTGIKTSDALNLTPDTVVSNVFTFGESLSGKTYDEAVKAVEASRENALSAKLHATSADEDKEWEATLDELGVQLEESDYEKVVEDCLQRGSLLTRYMRAKDYQRKPVNMTSGLVLDEEVIRANIEEALTDWNQEPTEAHATNRTGHLEIIGGQMGHVYDFSEGVHNFVEALKNGELGDKRYELEKEYTTVEPRLSAKRIEGFTVIGSCRTGYARPTDTALKNREQNLITSIAHVNGQVFAPGEVISALGMYGPVTTANGYASAGTYSASGHIDEVGGGLCQTTTTIYNAALMAELEIVLRKNHSYMVSYIDPSLDAMVYAPSGSDFKFKNTSSDFIIMDAYVDTANQYIYVNIIGHEDHPASHSVRYESKIISAVDMPAINYTPNSLDVGTEYNMGVGITSEFFASPGFQSQSYKITTDNGVETRTILTTDRYKRCDGAAAGPAHVRLYADFNANARNSYYMNLNTYYIDDAHTPITKSFVSMSDAQQAAFNASMAENLKKMNLYGWTATGSTKQPPTTLTNTPTDPDPSEESSSEESSSDESSSEPSSEPSSESPSEPAPEL